MNLSCDQFEVMFEGTPACITGSDFQKAGFDSLARAAFSLMDQSSQFFGNRNREETGLAFCEGVRQAVEDSPSQRFAGIEFT